MITATRVPLSDDTDGNGFTEEDGEEEEDEDDESLAPSPSPKIKKRKTGQSSAKKAKPASKAKQRALFNAGIVLDSSSKVVAPVLSQKKLAFKPDSKSGDGGGRKRKRTKGGKAWDKKVGRGSAVGEEEEEDVGETSTDPEEEDAPPASKKKKKASKKKPKPRAKKVVSSDAVRSLDASECGWCCFICII